METLLWNLVIHLHVFFRATGKSLVAFGELSQIVRSNGAF